MKINFKKILKTIIAVAGVIVTIAPLINDIVEKKEDKVKIEKDK